MGDKHGYGVLETWDGLRYEGGFKDDVFHGYGELYHPDKTVYKGMFKDGLKDGDCKIYWGLYFVEDDV
jgi:hypothetical protein